MTENKYNEPLNLSNVPKTNLHSNDDNIKNHLESNTHKSYEYHEHQRPDNHMHDYSHKNTLNKILYHSKRISHEHNSSSLNHKNSVISFHHKYQVSRTHKKIKPLERRLSMHFKRDLSFLIKINEHKNNSDTTNLPKISEDKIKMILNECQVLANINNLN